MTPLRKKAVAAGALLFVHALVVLSMDLYMGLAIGTTGLVLWGAWSSNHDPTWAALIVLAGVVQAAVLVASLFAAGFQMLAGVRGMQGNTRLLRPAALVAVGLPLLYLPVSLAGASCVGAPFWTVPLVLGLVTLALALEVVEEDRPVQQDWTGR